MYHEIRRALDLRWEPTRPSDLAEYRRCFDWEKPGDEEFLASLALEARTWLADNT